MSRQAHRPRSTDYNVTRLDQALADQGRDWAWLERETGFSRTYLRRLRRGERTISKQFAERASTALGVPEAELFSFDPTLPARENIMRTRRDEREGGRS